MAIANVQRALILGSVLEMLGIVALSIRFGAGRGGVPTLVIGAILVLIGLGVQIRILVRASRQNIHADLPTDARDSRPDARAT